MTNESSLEFLEAPRATKRLGEYLGDGLGRGGGGGAP